MKFENLLLIIDPQNDFCSPSGSLYVPGADDDMKRLCAWWSANQKRIDAVIISRDCHPEVAVFHPNWFEDANNNHPPAFTQIRANDLKNKKWFSLYQPEQTLEYLEKLEAKGRFVHTIWPLHCVAGTKGQELYPSVNENVINWEKATGNSVYYIDKGKANNTEHYGAFQAEVVTDDSTNWDIEALNKLAQYNNIYLAGEARSHCVATSLGQIMEKASNLIPRIKIITDAMSPVTGFEKLGQEIYQKALNLGATQVLTTDNFLE